MTSYQSTYVGVFSRYLSYHIYLYIYFILNIIPENEFKINSNDIFNFNNKGIINNDFKFMIHYNCNL